LLIVGHIKAHDEMAGRDKSTATAPVILGGRQQRPLLELSAIDFHGQLNGWIKGRLCFTFNPIESNNGRVGPGYLQSN
jgi:hypothetical protein